MQPFGFLSFCNFVTNASELSCVFARLEWNSVFEWRLFFPSFFVFSCHLFHQVIISSLTSLQGFYFRFSILVTGKVPSTFNRLSVYIEEPVNVGPGDAAKRVPSCFRPFISAQTARIESKHIQIWTVHCSIKIWAVNCQDERLDLPLGTPAKHGISQSSVSNLSTPLPWKMLHDVPT